jgi:hypothetical protein
MGIRAEVVGWFLRETPGTGKKELSSTYRYDVESIAGYKIYLRRPAALNKGFDFTVNVDGLYFKPKTRKLSNPSHSDVVAALQYVKTNDPNGFLRIIDAITEIYNCRLYNSGSLAGIVFEDYEGTTHPIEIILLAIKWLFIEQDITYWNWSGRNMLWGHIQAM